MQPRPNSFKYVPESLLQGGAVLVTQPLCVELLIHLQPSGPKVAVVAHSAPLLTQLELGA